MRKKFRKITAALLIIVMIVLMIPFSVICASAITQSEFDNRLNNLRNQYPNYSTWYDSFDGGTQCFGFARLVAYNVFGSHVRDWEVSYSIDGVKAGDVLQYGNTSGSGHTVFVTSVSGDTITFVDCNGNGNYSGGTKVRTCGIKWDNTINKWGNMYGRIGFSYRHVSPAIEPDKPVIHHWYDNYSPEYLGEWFLGRIEHPTTGMSLSSANENVKGAQTNDNMEQMWWFVRNSDGSYRIQNLVDEKYIHVWGSADDNNTNVISYGDYTGESNQNFFIYKINEHYCIRPSYSEKLWSIKEWGDYNVTIWDKVDTSTSEWFNIIRVTADRRMPQDLGSDFYAKIKHRSSDVYLTNQNNGIFGHEMTGAQNQIWHFKRQSNGSYSIQSVWDDSYVQVQDALDINDTRLISQSNFTKANHQCFFIYVMDSGGYCFKPLYSDKVWSILEWDDYFMSIRDKVEDATPQTFDIISTKAPNYWYNDFSPEYLGEWFLGRIEHPTSGMSLSSVNENVQGVKTNGSMEQMWWFVRNSDGSYRIQNLVDEKYIHIWGSSDINDTNVITFGNYTGERNQNFFIYKINDHYLIRPSCSDKLWSIKEWGDYNVTIWDKVDISTSEWFNIIRVTADRRMPQDLGSDFYAKIKQRSSDVYLTNQNNGIFGHEMTGAQNQIWHFVRQSNLSYSVQSVCDESYIQVQNALDVNDTRLVSQSSFTEANHQRFFIYVMDNGGYCFKPLYSDKVWSMKEWDDYYMSIWDKVEDASPQTFDIIPIEYSKPLIGDTNLDGIINVRDVTAIQRHLADLETFTEEQLAVSDTNGDGNVDIADATHLQMYLAEFDVLLGKQQ